jgi:predicted Ser/Thr protein kinase
MDKQKWLLATVLFHECVTQMKQVKHFFGLNELIVNILRKTSETK